MKLVVLESPYAGNVEENLEYAREAVADSLSMGESPIASHLLYTQPGILDDNDPEDRTVGIHAGHAWMDAADYVVVYTDKGITEGMQKGIEHAARLGLPTYFRELYPKTGFL